MRVLILLSTLLGATSLVLTPVARPLMAGATRCSAAAPLALARLPPAAAAAPRRAGAPQMGLFGLGAPELAIIAGVALLVLGPEQVKKLAKDIGKVSAELKQVPEEFSKGMEIGKDELDAKKGTTVLPPAPPNTDSPPDASLDWTMHGSLWGSRGRALQTRPRGLDTHAYSGGFRSRVYPPPANLLPCIPARASALSRGAPPPPATIR